METFRDIKGYNGIYQISTLGRVYNTKTKRFKVPYKTKTGYLQVNLYYKGECKTHLIHSLVVQAFVRDYNRDLEECNHINHNREDCRLQNLEILTKTEHKSDPITAYNISVSRKGFKQSEKTKEKIRNIRLGSKASDETKKKMSEAHKGSIPWNKGLQYSLKRKEI